MKNKLWCDLKTNKEKAEFLRSGRGSETGIIVKALELEVASLYEAAAEKAVASDAPGKSANVEKKAIAKK